ncbi:MAG: pentapeptide repeat-containing protein [Ruminococcus sp.]|nr:pentapeptide repeat-containing protein [Ruminococcus sp.]
MSDMEFLGTQDKSAAKNLVVYLVEFALKVAPIPFTPSAAMIKSLIENISNIQSTKALEKKLEQIVEENLKEISDSDAKQRIEDEIKWILYDLSTADNINGLTDTQMLINSIIEKRKQNGRELSNDYENLLIKILGQVFELLKDKNFFQNNLSEKDILLELLNISLNLNAELESLKKNWDKILLFIESLDATNNTLLSAIKNVSQNLQGTASKEGYTDNNNYFNNFTEQLFLHKEKHDKIVNLASTFVFQKYKVNNDFLEEPRDDLEQRLTDFVKSNDNKVLFILGDAGSGKTSLVSWLNHQYFTTGLFENRTLVTIRLRDLPKEDLEEKKNTISKVIFNYTKTKDYNDFVSVFKNPVIILDGYDELCLIHKEIGYRKFLNDLNVFRKACSIIITTRPDNNMNYNSLSLKKKEFIYLEHFDKAKRDEWIEKYTKECEQSIDQNVQSFIENINERNAEGVCDTPLLLYMLSSNDFSDKELSNDWAIYRKIFYDTITETPYNETFTESRHSISDYKDLVFKVNEELAYKMYESGNSEFSVKSDEIEKIVKKITDDVKISDILKNSYAICSYWKRNSNNGAIEFYHNNIRDFFLCEKIYSELNALYAQYENVSEKTLSDNEIKLFINKLCELFHFAAINPKVSVFIFLRAMYLKDNKSDFTDIKLHFPEIESKHRFLPIFFEELLTNGSYMCKFIGSAKNPINEIYNIFVSIINIYSQVYEPYLNEDEKYSLWNNVYKVNDNRLFHQALCACRKTIIFGRADLSRANLSGANLIGAKLRIADLIGADLIGADLSGADLSGAYLSGANLRIANLSGANLIGANLSGANLIRASLSGAYLSGAYLSGTNLSGAILPDGSMLDSQKKQVKRLKKLFPDIKILF